MGSRQSAVGSRTDTLTTDYSRLPHCPLPTAARRSRRMYAFEYHRPTSVRQAANLLGKLDEAKIVAGGHTLLPTMKQRLAEPKNLIDLAGVADLRGIERSGGSVANNDPAADYPAACLALGATIATNKRKIAADDYFKGLFETALEDGEIVTKVTFPIPQKAGYMKFRNPASRYALVGVFVAKRAAEIRVAVTGAGAGGVFRWAAAEEALKKRFAAKSLEGLSHPADGLNGDIHADATYRAHLIGVMARRAVQAATDR